MHDPCQETLSVLLLRQRADVIDVLAYMLYEWSVDDADRLNGLHRDFGRNDPLQIVLAHLCNSAYPLRMSLMKILEYIIHRSISVPLVQNLVHTVGIELSIGFAVDTPCFVCWHTSQNRQRVFLPLTDMCQVILDRPLRRTSSICQALLIDTC
jgi:hypothetical protein